MAAMLTNIIIADKTPYSQTLSLLCAEKYKCCTQFEFRQGWINNITYPCHNVIGMSLVFISTVFRCTKCAEMDTQSFLCVLHNICNVLIAKI